MVPSSLVRRSAAACAALITLVVSTLSVGVLASGCGEDATGGRRVSLSTRASLAPAAAEPFTNAYGWTITLTKVAVATGPLYYFDGSPSVEARLRPEPPLDMLRRWASVRAAHAHPGHYEPGNTKGEVLQPSSVDLLAGPLDLPAGAGVSGVVRSARFSFSSPPVGPAAALLEGHVVIVEAEAVKGDLTRTFVATADVADVVDTSGEPRVEGCTFEEADVQADGAVEVEINPAVWLDQVELDAVPESQDGSPVALAPGEVPHKAFTRGLKKGSAYVFRYVP